MSKRGMSIMARMQMRNLPASIARSFMRQVRLAMAPKKSAFTGPGRVTVFTHHNYIHDPRREDWGRVPAGRRPGDGR